MSLDFALVLGWFEQGQDKEWVRGGEGGEIETQFQPGLWTKISRFDLFQLLVKDSEFI